MYSKNNNEKEGKAIRKSKEKQVRIIARKKRNEKNKEEKREHRDKKENGEYRKIERLKSEVRKQECDRGMHH